MKVSKLVVMISAALSVSAHAMTIEQANANVARAEQAYARAVEAYKNDTYVHGSSVAQGHYDTLNTAGQIRAEAYADKRAAVAQHQSEVDAADKAQAIKERNQAIIDSNNAGMSHRPATQWNMTPGITKESNPAGKPTGQVSPMDPNHWTQQPAIVKESNPAGHPTNQIAPATHLDSSTADQQAAAAAKAAAETQHKAAIANYGVKGNPNLVSQYSQATQVTYSGATVRPGYSAVNVAASSLPHNANVTVATPDGTKTVTASTLKPDTQVSVPMNPVFSRSTFANNGHNGANAHASHEGGRGSDNAHSEAFGGHGYGHDNSASEGFGGHSQFH